MDVGGGLDGVFALFARVVAFPHTPGIVGSVFALKWAGTSWSEKVFAVGFGVACALWAAPAAAAFVGLQTDAVARLVSLFCGAYGARLGDQIAEGVNRIDLDLGAWATRLWPFGARK